MTELEIYGMPGHLIRRAHQIVVSMFVEETAGFGVTPVQFAALAAIHRYPGIDQRRLSRLIAFDRSTIGDVVERLERKGLLRREFGLDDQRSKRMSLTDTGEEALVAIRRHVAASQERFLEPLSPRERAQFMRLIAKAVHLNNEFSRAPLDTEARTRQPAPAG